LEVIRAKKGRATGRRKSVKRKYIITVRDVEKSTSEKEQKRGPQVIKQIIPEKLRDDIEDEVS
jgi:hypothetical protein